MPDQQPRPPLAQTLHGAYWLAAGLRSGDLPPLSDPECYVAMIRAVADWLVPEEAEPEWGYVGTHENYLHCRWGERKHLRQLLLDEARKAEAGE